MVKTRSDVAHIPKRGEEKKAIPNWSNDRARRWVVERSHSWMNRNQQLLICWEKQSENDLG